MHYRSFSLSCCFFFSLIGYFECHKKISPVVSISSSLAIGLPNSSISFVGIDKVSKLNTFRKFKKDGLIKVTY